MGLAGTSSVRYGYVVVCVEHVGYQVEQGDDGRPQPGRTTVGQVKGVSIAWWNRTLVITQKNILTSNGGQRGSHHMDEGRRGMTDDEG